MRVTRPLPASISGRLHVPDGADIVHVIVTPNGSTEAERSGFDHDSSFEIDGLVTGRRYDVAFSGPHLRTLRLIGVVAPAADLEVALEARAVIHVAVGFPRGERCPIDMLQLRAREDGITAEEGGLVFSSDCRFEFEAPPLGGEVAVIAEGGGFKFESVVTIPAHGDPEPICLNPPCRANPLDGQAHLRVMVDSVASVEATIVPVGDPDTRYGCVSPRFWCDIDLPAGRMYTINASGRGCRGGPVFAALSEGENTVSVPCASDPPATESPDPPDDVDS
jgi:hypothetical protein